MSDERPPVAENNRPFPAGVGGTAEKLLCLLVTGQGGSVGSLHGQCLRKHPINI